MKIRILFAGLALVCMTAGAQNYPTKPIHMIIPFAPGGASDFVGRIISPKYSELLGQQIVIDNRAGASGNIGVEVAAKAPPDGYTIFLGNIGTIAINPTVQPASVDTAKDFIAVSQVADVPSILVAHPSLPANSVAEFVALARSRPGALNFASPGSSTLNRLEMESFMKITGIKMVHVPYKGGAGPAVTGLLGAETHVMFVTLVSASNFVKAGKLKAFAVTTKSRVDTLPQVPTMIESGYPDMVSSSWQGLFVPAGAPRAIVMRLHDDLVKTLETADVKQRFAAGGALTAPSGTPEEFAAFVRSEIARWGKVATESGATVD